MNAAFLSDLKKRLRELDPAIYYLIGFVVLVGIVVIVGSYVMPAPASASHFHREFPSEYEVHSVVRMGQSEEDVIAELGDPLSRGELDENVTVLNYVMPMTKEPPNDKDVYCGFSVYIKSGKVMDINIIRGSDLRN